MGTTHKEPRISIGPCGVYSWLKAVAGGVVGAVLECTTVHVSFFRLDTISLKSRIPGIHGDSGGETFIDFCGNGEPSVWRDEGVFHNRI